MLFKRSMISFIFVLIFSPRLDDSSFSIMRFHADTISAAICCGQLMDAEAGIVTRQKPEQRGQKSHCL